MWHVASREQCHNVHIFWWRHTHLSLSTRTRSRFTCSETSLISTRLQLQRFQLQLQLRQISRISTPTPKSNSGGFNSNSQFPGRGWVRTLGLVGISELGSNLEPRANNRSFPETRGRACVPTKKIGSRDSIFGLVNSTHFFLNNKP